MMSEFSFLFYLNVCIKHLINLFEFSIFVFPNTQHQNKINIHKNIMSIILRIIQKTYKNKKSINVQSKKNKKIKNPIPCVRS